MKFSLSSLLTLVAGVAIGLGGVSIWASTDRLLTRLDSAISEVTYAAEMVHPYSPEDRVYIHPKTAHEFNIIILRREPDESADSFRQRVNRHLAIFSDSTPLPLSQW